MKIYTSYFSNGAKLAKAGIMMIGIALYPPKWFTGLSNKYVSPSWDILHNSKSEEDYVQRFNSEILAHRDPKAFLSAIDDFCHRHLVAKWLNEKLGIQVEEFGISKNPVYSEQSLF